MAGDRLTAPRLLAVAPCVLALAAVLLRAAPAQDDLRARIDQFVQGEMERQHIPGVAVAVVRSGGVLEARGYGYANVELQVPVSPDTIFQSGSLGKQFTAAGVILQVEDGKLSLSDPITKFSPDAPPSWRSCELR